jgi:hypothetical protein
MEKNLYSYYYDLYYEKTKLISDVKITNYDSNFCCKYCKTHDFIPNMEINNFLNKHLVLNKNKKFLLMAYRLIPEIFIYHDISTHELLKNFLQNNSGQLTNNYKYMFPDISNPNTYTYNFDRAFRFASLFYQPNLAFEDYLRCDLCKNYVCPYHIYLSNCLFKKCTMCNKKKWVICGWCKFDFNEYWGCIIVHHDNLLPQNLIVDTNSNGNFI